MEKSVQIVEINKITPVFKDGVEAERIQVVNFKFANGDECGYNVVTAKNLYNIGDKAVYIQPDYCLSDLPIFESFIRPNGDESKSRLGKNFRIRAIKFNFSFNNTSDPIYSFGILMPLSEVNEYIKNDYSDDELPEILGITKYEEPEKGGSGLIAGDFPSFMYKTDEPNIANLKSHVSRVIDSGSELGLSIKVDGSSFSMWCKKIDGEWKYGICSRSQEKKLDQFYIDKYIDSDNNAYHKYSKRNNDGVYEKGWFCDETSVFYTDDEILKLDNLTCIKHEVRDSWVDVANKDGLTTKLVDYCKKNDVQLVFRGELNGSGLKGSGCRVNPDANNKQNIKLFGVDSLESGYSIRQHYGDTHNLKKIGDECSVNYTSVKIVKPSSYDNLIEMCEEIAKFEKENGRIIEGVVIRTMYDNSLSCKWLSPEYDSKK